MVKSSLAKKGCLAIARHDIVGVGASLSLGMTEKGCRPEPFFCHPRAPFFCRPERSEGSLGAYMSQPDRGRDALDYRGVSSLDKTEILDKTKKK